MTDRSLRDDDADDASAPAAPASSTTPAVLPSAAPPAAPPAAPSTPTARDDRGLRYPIGTPPLPGRMVEVRPGVYWIRMALPFRLDHINLYAIEDDDGWALVDTGVRNEETMAAWRVLFQQSPDGRRLSRIFVTHMHPDHIGMAGWLARKFDVSLWMTRLEYLHCRMLVSDSGREAPDDALRFYRRAGWGEAALETYRVRFGRFGKLIHPLPDSFQRLADGQVLRMAGRDWQVIVGSGHSPEHACLHCPSLGLLISGDQVLPRISSNVSVYPVEPEADPLGDWLASIDRLRARVPADTLVLPAHGEVFEGLHTRLDALAGGQQRALARLRQRLDTPQRAIDVFGALFARAIAETDVDLLGMATGESLACLNHLHRRGEVRRTLGDDGAYRYQLADAAG